jgi:hypothetical protein
VFSSPIVPSCTRLGRQTSRFVTDSAISVFGDIRVLAAAVATVAERGLLEPAEG